MGRRKGRSKAVQLRFFAKIHVSMCRFPYIGKCCSELSRAVGKDGDATWPRRAYQNSYLSLYVHQRYIYVTVSDLISTNGIASGQRVKRSTQVSRYLKPSAYAKGLTISICMWSNHSVGSSNLPKTGLLW